MEYLKYIIKYTHTLMFVINKTVLSCVLWWLILVHMESYHSECLDLILMAGSQL